MIQDDFANRHSAESLDDRSRDWIDALKTRRLQPSVSVKRRRRLAVQGGGSSGSDESTTLRTDRSARTYRVTVAPDERAARDERRTEGSPVGIPPAAAEPEVHRSPRRRRDPARVPGAVHHVVFDPPPRESLDARPGEAAQLVAVGFAEVMRALATLERTLGDVQTMSRFRLG